MIYGIGTDLVELARVEQTYHRFGERFVERLLMDEERELFDKNTQPIRFLAMRFAGKEATVKAMGTGFSNGVWIRDVGIVTNALGKPEIVWSKRGKDVCDRLGIGEGFISLTDDAGLILAFAVILRKN